MAGGFCSTGSLAAGSPSIAGFCSDRGAAIFLASRAGDYVMGSTLIVDGGVTHARG